MAVETKENALKQLNVQEGVLLEQTSRKQRKNLKSVLKTLLALFFLLAMLALIAAGLYVSVLAFPAIAAALGTALALNALPQAIILLIAALPIILLSAVLLKFLQLHIEKPISMNEVPFVYPISQGSLAATWNRIADEPVGYLLEIILRSLIVPKLDSPQRDSQGNLKDGNGWMLFSVLAMLSALGLGIFLSVQILPALLAAVAVLGVPFPVAVIFAATAVLAIIGITYQMIVSPLILRNALVAFGMKALQWRDHPSATLHFLIAVIAMGGAIALSTVFFPLLANVLVPLLAPGLATFTALAITVSLTVLMVRLAPALLVEPFAYLHKKHQDKKWQDKYTESLNKIEIPPSTEEAPLSTEHSRGSQSGYDSVRDPSKKVPQQQTGNEQGKVAPSK